MTQAVDEIRHEVSARTATNAVLTDPVPDFSLVLGGPIFQLFRRSHLTGDALELSHRRILLITLVAWLPLPLLAILGSKSLGDAVNVSFVHDIEAHVRLLVALPVLIAAELIVHSRIRLVIQAFAVRRIVPPQDMPTFLAAIDSAIRLRNSVPVELGLLFLVFTAGQWLWRSQALATSTWYATVAGGHLHLTAAGCWYAFVSIPIFQFILLRWYLRFFIWFQLLWRISRLHLHLNPAHPDRAGGLSFLGKSAYAFSPILFAEGALLSGLIASHILHEGRSLFSFKTEAVGMIVFFLIVILGPLTMFTPQLLRAKRAGLIDYGLLANRYVESFEQKWVRGTTSADDELLGTSDIQSLADLGNSYAIVREMRPVPFDLQDIAWLAAGTLTPLVPLALTVFSFDELVIRILKVLF